MAAPVLLAYNLENQQKLKLLFTCAQLKIGFISVPRADYAQPIAALAGVRARDEGVYEGEGFSDEMLVMANFTNNLFQAFMNALKRSHGATPALKAVMTPTNAEWDSLKLHAEILKEHEEMHRKK